MNFPILFCILVSIFNNFVSGDYSYKNPHEWAKTYPACGGSKRSPIDLGADAVSKILDVDCPVVEYYRYYDKPCSLVLTNDGRALKIEGTWYKDPMVKLDNELIKGSYRFYQIRLHWGQGNENSTEHTVQESGGALEIHVIHLNNKYEEDDEALAAEDGVLIIARGYSSAEDEQEVTDLQFLQKRLAKVQEIGSSTKLQQMTLSEMGFKNNDLFFVYKGSMTQPPCTENVLWLYSLVTGIVSQNMIETLRKTKLLHGDRNNIRPVQKLGDRTVTSLSCK